MARKHKKDRSPALQIEYLPTSKLEPRERNPRVHSARQIQQIAASIKEFGFRCPILIDDSCTVIAGHARLAAAKLLQIQRIPTLCCRDLSAAQLRAFVIADNKLAEAAEWDFDILADEFGELIKLDFDVEVTGFETPEIDVVLRANDDVAATDAADALPDLHENHPAVARPGDLWVLGRHRLFCGDATAPDAYEAVLGGKKARMIFADPPYNVPINGHVSGLGKRRHREFVMACGEMTSTEFIRFLETVARHLAANSKLGSLHYVCMDWRHLYDLLSATREIYHQFMNLCVWGKTLAGMGSFYRSQHELVCVFKNGQAKHTNNVELGRLGRYRTNLWSYPGFNGFHPGREEALEMHPTVKPVALVADAILDASKHGELVLDPFSGSGTTILAAERTGRRAAAIEIDPLYVDLAVRRFEKLTGEHATLAATGRTFAKTAAKRTKGNGDGK